MTFNVGETNNKWKKTRLWNFSFCKIISLFNQIFFPLFSSPFGYIPGTVTSLEICLELPE